MKLSLILSQARGGELKSLSQKDKTDEVIIDYINLALIALYTRFQLKTEEAIIALQTNPPKTIYTLSSSDNRVTVGGQPMTDDDVMAIMYAYNETGRYCPINDEKDQYSISTVSYNQVQIPLIEENTYVSIIYRKNPTLITFVDSGSGKAADANVEIPIQLLEPMLHYIGYRAHGSIDGSLTTENNSHYMRFEAACRRANELGVLTADDVSSLSVQQKGFA